MAHTTKIKATNTSATKYAIMLPQQGLSVHLRVSGLKDRSNIPKNTLFFGTEYLSFIVLKRSMHSCGLEYGNLADNYKNKRTLIAFCVFNLILRKKMVDFYKIGGSLTPHETS